MNTKTTNALDINQLEKAIREGDVEAQYQLALIYHHGADGIEVDTKKAYDLYKQAADAGHTGARFNIIWSIFKNDSLENTTPVLPPAGP